MSCLLETMFVFIFADIFPDCSHQQRAIWLYLWQHVSEMSYNIIIWQTTSFCSVCQLPLGPSKKGNNQTFSVQFIQSSIHSFINIFRPPYLQYQPTTKLLLHTVSIQAFFLIQFHCYFLFLLFQHYFAMKCCRRAS